eukprot:GILJ01008958.1.p1 GENE.GILJ01008958.1~~GILJ01008958.1.p1  ORF type:complete len:106 (+),score=8.69 GILJ01008958.1:485-802(+)
MLADVDELAVPSCKWLGVTMDDIDEFGLDRSIMQKLSPRDVAKIEALLGRPYLSESSSRTKKWREHLLRMRGEERKFEVEALSCLAPDFLRHTYLPQKLANMRIE